MKIREDFSKSPTRQLACTVGYERGLLEKAYIVGVRLPKQSREESKESLEELMSLAYSAGAKVVGVLEQELKRIDPAFFIGKGKVEELASKALESKCQVIIFDEDLSASQNRNLEEKLKMKVVDRTGLILDIFAQRARTKEGKLQVALAQALYLLPRLVGQWAHFSRQTGGIGTRGPGETQLEVDRRRVREKISKLRRELEKVASSRHLHRTQRLSIPIPTVSLVGYTNAGKSTLMNAMTEAGVLVEDKLFATLDPTVRKLKLPSGREVLLADTVGFIRKLPHTLVESFKATFEEIAGSDLLIHVIDISHPGKMDQIRQVRKVLGELNLSGKPIIEVYNKVDRLGPFHETEKNKIYLSALKKKNLTALLEKIEQKLARGFKKVFLKLPHTEGMLLSFLYQYCRIVSVEYGENEILIQAEVYEKYLSRLKPYLVKNKKKGGD